VIASLTTNSLPLNAILILKSSIMEKMIDARTSTIWSWIAMVHSFVPTTLLNEYTEYTEPTFGNGDSTGTSELPLERRETLNDGDEKKDFRNKVLVVAFIILTFLVMIYCKVTSHKADSQRRNTSENPASRSRRGCQQDRTATSTEMEDRHNHQHPRNNQKIMVSDHKDFVTKILRTEKYDQTLRASQPIYGKIGNKDYEKSNNNHKNSWLDECTVCMEPFHYGEEICKSLNKACPHFFHRKCIVQWLADRELCPCCRRNYLHFDVELGHSEHHSLTTCSSSSSELQSSDDNLSTTSNGSMHVEANLEEIVDV
jgi:hypothetical protein